MGGDDDLGSAHHLGDLQFGHAGEVGLGQVELGTAHDAGDIAAPEIFRDDLFMHAAEDGCGVHEVFRGITFFHRGETLGCFSSPSFRMPAPVAAVPPMAPVALGRDDDHHAYEDEYGRPDEALKGEAGVVVLQEEEAPDKDEHQPGASPEIMPQSYEEAGDEHRDMPVE